MTPQLQGHIAFWDKWHEEWFQQVSQQKIHSEVWGWPVPDVIGGKKIFSTQFKTVDFFPEPYWGNINAPATALFININPGEGGYIQHIDTYKYATAVANPVQNEADVLWSYYKNNNHIYSQTVQSLSKVTNYPTTQWLLDNRDKWANQLIHKYDGLIEYPCKENSKNTVAFEFCPWHTKQEAQITDYLKGNKNVFSQTMLDFILEKASNDMCGPLRKIVFGKGKYLPQIISPEYQISLFGDEKIHDDVTINKNNNEIRIKTGKNGDWVIHIFLISGVYFVNCKGSKGGGNGFPKSEGPFWEIIKRIIAIPK